MDKIFNGAFDPAFGQGTRLESIDGCFQRTRRNVEWVVAVTPTVQYLHEDMPPFFVHRLGNHPVLFSMTHALHTRSIRSQYAASIRAYTSCDNKARSTSGSFRVKRCQLREPIGLLFKTQVHAAHDDAVRQREVCHLQRGE